MLVIRATRQRMETEAYSGQWTHVREDPHGMTPSQ